MPSRMQLVCVPCRNVSASGALPCDHSETAVQVSKWWRAPSRSNDRAWKLIAAGAWLWDRAAVNKKAADAARKRGVTARLLQQRDDRVRHAVARKEGREGEAARWREHRRAAVLADNPNMSARKRRKLGVDD